MTEPVFIAGLRITPLSLTEAVDAFLSDAEKGNPRVYAFVNGQSASLRRADNDYSRALDDPRTLGLVDGAAVEIAGRLRGLKSIERCPGPDFFASAAAAAQSSGVSFFLLGGKDGVADQVAERLVSENPGLRIAGTLCPPFGEWDEQTSAGFVAAVLESGAQALWLGVSAPKQEVWATQYAQRLGIPTACVGAAFDFIAGTVPRAPKWMRSARLEWLFRLGSEPRRLWRRYLVGNTVFIIDFIRFGARKA